MSSMPDRQQHIHGDETFDELSRGDLALIEREAQRLTAAKLISSDWWNEQLEGVNPITAELPFLLSNLASKALAAEITKGRGVEILDAGIAIAVTQFVLRQGRDMALAEARHEAEEKLIAGEIS